MPATKISELLPIPDGAKTPHAYQVFGLEGGEQDREKIKSAVAEIYRRLKDAKADTDPALWRKAAKLVEKARGILSDPKKRAALDARFGVIQFDDVADNDAPAADPLAGILPASDPLAVSNDPLAAVVPSGNPMAVGVLAQPGAGMAPVGVAPTAPDPMMPPSLADERQLGGTAVQSLPVAAATTAPSASDGHPVVLKAKKSTRRRRKAVLGTLMFGIFMLGMFGIIAALLYFFVAGPGHLSVTSKDGQLSISTSPQEQPPTPIYDPLPGRPISAPVNNDPVLGRVPKGPARPAGSLADANPMANPNGTSQTGEVTIPPMQSTPQTSPVQPEPTQTEPPSQPDTTTNPDTPAETEPDPEMTPENMTPENMKPENPSSEVLPVTPGQQESPPTEMTDDMIAVANAAIANVEQLIQQADWEQMKPAASKVTEMTLSDQQREYADALYHLADLATFYRGGIVKGIGTLQTASTFDIAEGVSVLVVETTREGLTIRRGARNKDYTVDNMPFSLAETLCSFALSPDKPDNIAARSCFQSIAPQSSADYRKDALTWLEFVNQDVEGVDTKKVAEAIKKLFPD